jgi:hypothetical protein
MKRQTGITVLALLLASTPTFSQDLGKPTPVAPGKFLGPQLIAWSQTQKPQPVADAAPQPNQTDNPGQSSNEKAQAPAQQPGPDTQTITGTIVKDSGRYVLKVSSSSTTYELDDQDRAQQYEGKQVKVSGTPSAKGDSFHVVNIELIS